MFKIRKRHCPVCGHVDPIFKRLSFSASKNQLWSCGGCGSLLRENYLDVRFAILCAVIFKIGSELFFAVMSRGGRPVEIGLAIVAYLGMTAGAIAIYPWISSVRVKSAGPHCMDCRYDLQGVPADHSITCPECGKPIPQSWLDKRFSGVGLEKI